MEQNSQRPGVQRRLEDAFECGPQGLMCKMLDIVLSFVYVTKFISFNLYNYYYAKSHIMFVVFSDSINPFCCSHFFTSAVLFNKIVMYRINGEISMSLKLDLVLGRSPGLQFRIFSRLPIMMIILCLLALWLMVILKLLVPSLLQ